MQPSIRDLMASGETLVFGHRGAMAYAPMNTLASFKLAQAQGADGIELDVQLSSDGHPVVIHDNTVDGTTDGIGIVREMSLAELKALGAGGWYSDQFSGERIPTLDEVFQELTKPLLINVEIKRTSDTSVGIEEVVVDCIQRHKMKNRVIVSSFDPYVLRRVRMLLPELMVGALIVPGVPIEYEQIIGQLQLEALHPWHEDVDNEFMNRARDYQRLVNVWTINEPTRALKLKAMGVNAVITDNPKRILAAFS